MFNEMLYVGTMKQVSVKGCRLTIIKAIVV